MPLHTPMRTFWTWLELQTLLRHLLESSSAFDPKAYNKVFENQLANLQSQITDPEISAKLENLKGMDWGGYIAKELRKAGFRGNDLEEYVHHIVVKLLVTPGKLFQGWNPSQHGPLELLSGIRLPTSSANRSIIGSMLPRSVSTMTSMVTAWPRSFFLQEQKMTN